jgi:hypothetical protein
MFKLVKIIGVLAVMLTTVDRASALSFTTSTTSIDYSITNLSSFTINGDILFFTGFDPGSGGLSGLQTSTFTLLSGQNFSEVIAGFTAGGSYHTVFNGGGAGTPTSFAEAVPLPAGFPLFAMALLVLGALGYVGTRKKGAAPEAEVFAA